MTAIDTRTILKQLASVFREGVEGPLGESGYFSDPSPDAGLNKLLAGIDATTASRDIGGNSVAAHVRHLAFSFRVSTDWLRGRANRPDWRESWSVTALDNAAWAQLRADLTQAYTDMEDAVANHAFDTEMNMGIALGNIAHNAYHLGAIRQKLKMLA